MQKLTHLEAQDLIKKAWEMVALHTLGSYRFGQALWWMIPEANRDEYALWDKDYNPPLFNGYHGDIDFYYEQNPDIVIEKFYKWFVEDSNN